MAHGTVVILGRLPIERGVVECLESQFGFSFRQIESLQALPDMDPSDDVIAVLFNPSSAGVAWDESLNSVLHAFPRAFPILCHGFADPIDWPQAADAGAFHSIPVPIKLAELRQSLGFVWVAREDSNSSRGKKSAGDGPPARALAAIVA